MGQTKRQFKKEVMFTESTLEGLRTIDFVKHKVQDHFLNKYSCRVVDQSGNDVTSSVVSGNVSFFLYTTGADRALGPVQTIDLSISDRNFTPFYEYVERVIFTVTGLTPGYRVIATALRMDD